jgi:cytochrome c biogenesis protein ResB
VWHSLRRALRSRSIIIAELLLVAAAGVILTLVPQEGDTETTPGRPLPPLVARFSSLLALDHVLSSVWFSTLVALCSVTLGLVLWDQWRRVARVWGEQLTASHFHGAPFTSEFVSPGGAGPDRAEFRISGNVGILGTPIFHSGLMCVMVAGLLRVLFGQDAQVDLVEGEELPMDAQAYGAQWGGLFATPFVLTTPLRFDALQPSRYKGTGNLESLSATVTLGESRAATVAVNTPLDVGWERVYLTAIHGPVALLEHKGPEGEARGAAMMKDGDEQWVYTGQARLEHTLEVRTRVDLRQGSELPQQVEVRVMRRGGLVFAGMLTAGVVTEIAPGETLTLHGVRWWARFNGSRDKGTWLAYLGFVLSILGAMLMFGVSRVDTYTRVTTREDGQHVLLSMKPHRFAPIYADRFEELKKKLGHKEPP